MLGELRDKCRETFRRAKMTILGPGRLRESIARVCVSTSASSEEFFQRLGRVLLGTEARRTREPFSKDASQGWRCSIGSWGDDKERFAGA